MKESRKISTKEDSGNRGTKDERERAWRELREGDARGEKLELRELNGEGCETSSRTQSLLREKKKQERGRANRKRERNRNKRSSDEGRGWLRAGGTLILALLWRNDYLRSKKKGTKRKRKRKREKDNKKEG